MRARTLAALVAAVLLTTLSPSPAQAHPASRPHGVYKADGCYSGLYWSYEDNQGGINWTDDQTHRHNWYLYGLFLDTEGHIQYEWAIRGWTCGLGRPVAQKNQWIDYSFPGGRLVHRQLFQTHYIQIVFNGTCQCPPYSVQVYR